MYSFDSVVRYSEIDESGRLSILAILNYLQDCSTFQSESLGKGMSYLKDNSMAWWLSNWQLEIKERPKLCDKINICTFAYDFKNIYGYRNFGIRDDKGNYLIKADSIWFCYDLKTNKPRKPVKEDIELYLSAGESKWDMPDTKRKLETVKDADTVNETVITRQYIDTNHHVNNAYYVEIAKDVLPESFEIKRIEVQYKTAAKLGDRLILKCGIRDGAYIVELTSDKGDSYAVVSFR